MDHSADDAFHAKVVRDCHIGAMTGQIQMPPETTRWRLKYLCNHCSRMHAVTGNFEQMSMTLQFFMILGYPILEVKDEGFATLVDLEGYDLDTQAGLDAAAEAYQAFCDATRD